MTRSLPLFEMFQSRVDYFLHSMQLRTPGIFSVIEPLVHGVESRIDVGAQIAKARVIYKDSHQYGDGGDTNGKGDLNALIGHRIHQHTPSTATPPSTVSQLRRDLQGAGQ